MANLIDVIGKVLIKSKGRFKKMEIEEAWKDFNYEMEIEIDTLGIGKVVKDVIEENRKTEKKKIVKKGN